MSNDDTGDSSSRLSDALDAVFSSRRQPDGTPSDGAAPDEPYELPDIVPATDDPPRLPERAPSEPAAPSVRSTAAPSVPSAATPAPAAAPNPVAPSAPTHSVGPSDPGPAAAAPATPVTGWGDHMPAVTPSPSAQLRAPGRRPRVRRVTRVLRHIDPWSTFKVALLFSVVAYVVALTSGVLLWRVADSTGTLDNVERWFTQFGWETFELKGGEIFHNAWIIGLFGVVAMTGAAVLLVTLFNLVSDIVGGVRMTVLEEEVVERTISSTRRYVVRTAPADVATRPARTSAWSVDDDADVGERDPDRSDGGVDLGGAVAVGGGDLGGAVADAGNGSSGADPEPTREQPTGTWSVD